MTYFESYNPPRYSGRSDYKPGGRFFFDQLPNNNAVLCKNCKCSSGGHYGDKHDPKSDRRRCPEPGEYSFIQEFEKDINKNTRVI